VSVVPIEVLVGHASLDSGSVPRTPRTDGACRFRFPLRSACAPPTAAALYA